MLYMLKKSVSYLLITWALSFACIGCIVGAVQAEPAEDLELDADSEEALKNAFEQVNVQEEMRDRILRIARERTNYTFVNLRENKAQAPLMKNLIILPW